MKKHIVYFVFLITIIQINGQVSGNINYSSTHSISTYKGEKTIEIYAPSQSTNYQVLVKGMYNIKPDHYVAHFSVTQFGTTVDETNKLMQKRLMAIEELLTKQNIETYYIDIISFVPIYEWEVEKKIFSNRTYNEVPKGFESKKNLVIQFSDHKLLHDIQSICAENEVYDLIRVDVFSTQIEKAKEELATKAAALLNKKLKTAYSYMKKELDSSKLTYLDKFQIYYPFEQYQEYVAYSNSEANLRKSGTVKQIEKNKSQFYQPIYNKDLDFVLEPVVLEPCIQLLYEVTLVYEFPVVQGKDKNIHLITPSGELKSLSW